MTQGPLLDLIHQGVLAGFSPRVSAVRSDHHDDGPRGHAGGRAVDFDMVDGITVGVNEPTVRFIVTMMRRGARQIGTIPALANNPDLQALARQTGTQLFADEGTGPHVHVGI